MLPESQDVSDKKRKNIVGILVSLIILTITATLGVAFWNQQNGNGFSIKITKKPGSSVPAPSPTPLKEITNLPEGPQTYTLSHGKDVTGPKPGSFTIDPLDPGKGNNQKLSIIVSNESPVTKAEVELITDNGKKMHELILGDKSDNQQTWEGSWTIDDSYNYIYSMRMILAGANGTFDQTLFFR